MSEIATDTDWQLLARYTRCQAEDAFAEIVRRHLDLVHSAAFRQVRSSQLAEEVTQSVFTDLARNAARLTPDTIVTAWLYQVTRRTAIDVVRREARRQLREQIATEMNVMNATADDWTHIEPLLDDAMSALDETDRAAVLLRYFENKSLREVGETLGTSDDAAQKRVSRAVERLREFFTKRGVSVGTSGLVVVISTNAVQAAPVGMVLTISSAAILAGTTITTTATVAATKVIAMTTLQKAAITATVAVLAGAGIYKAREASQLGIEVQTPPQQHQSLQVENIQQLQRERDETIRQLAALRADFSRLNPNTNNAELLKLRGEVGVLRRQLTEYKSSEEANTKAKKPFTYRGFDFSHGDPPLNFPTVAWVYSGHSNPESTLYTLMWAFREGNMSVIMNTLAPESSTSWEKLFGANSTDEIPEKGIAYTQQVGWFDLVDKKVISDGEVQLVISLRLNNKDDIRTVSVKNVRGQWRVGGLVSE